MGGTPCLGGSGVARQDDDCKGVLVGMAEQLSDQSVESSQPSAAVVRTARLLVAALAGGTMLFAVVVLWINNATGPRPAPSSSVGALIGGVAAILLVVGVIVGWVLARRVAVEANAGRVVQNSRLLGIVVARAALIEGPALLGAIAALLAGPPYLLTTFVGAGLLAALWVTLPGSLRDLSGDAVAGSWRRQAGASRQAD